MKKQIFNKVAIIGGGLIGTSIAMSIRKNLLANHVFIYDSNQKVREKLRANSIADKVC